MCKKWTDAGITTKTVRNRLSVLRTALSDAVQNEIIEISPMYGWEWQAPNKVKKKKRDHVDPFTQTEQSLILSKLAGQDYNLFQFAFWTGLRTSEMVGLDWGDIDWQREEIHVRRALTRAAIRAGEFDEGTKTEASDRRVKILTPAMEVLIAQKAHTLIINEAIFHNPRTDERWRGSNPIWDKWKKMLA